MLYSKFAKENKVSKNHNSVYKKKCEVCKVFTIFLKRVTLPSLKEKGLKRGKGLI